MCINPRQRLPSTTPVVIFPFRLSEVSLYLAEGFEDGGFDVLTGKPAVEVNQAALAAVCLPEVIPVDAASLKKKRVDELINGRIHIQ